jgi:hypothetical protein
MRKRISRTMAVIVVSALMVVLTAGVAFAATVNCPQGGGDTIDVKDNTPGDKVDCGDARDRVSADSGDIVFANCEVVR